MTDKFSLKEICGEYKFFEKGDSFPLTEKQILNKLNENEQLKQQNKMLRTNVRKLTDDVKYLRNLPSTHQKENKQLKQIIEDILGMPYEEYIK